MTEDPAEFGKYGIDKPTAEVTLFSGSAKAGLAFGTKTTDAVHVRDLSKPMIVTAPTDLLDELNKAASDYRRKDVFEFRAFNLDTIDLTRNGTTTTYERLKGKGKDGADAWQVAATKKAIDPAKFEAALSKLAGLKAQSFAEAATRTGLDTPILTVKSVFDEKKKTEVVTIGRVGAEVFVGRADEPGAARLDTTEWDEALKAFDEFK